MPLFSLAVSTEPPIRAAPCRVPDQWLLSPRLELYVDRLALTEWWGWRRVRCRLPLGGLKQVDAPAPKTLALQPGAGARCDLEPKDSPLTLKVDGAERWARSIRAFRACLDDPR